MKKVFFLSILLFFLSTPLYAENFVLKERVWKTIYLKENAVSTSEAIPLPLDELKTGNVVPFGNKLVQVEGYVVPETDKSFRIKLDTTPLNTGCSSCVRSQARMRPRVVAPPDVIAKLKDGLVRVIGMTWLTVNAEAPEPVLSLSADKIEVPA
jgi:hypothetical protein